MTRALDIRTPLTCATCARLGVWQAKLAPVVVMNRNEPDAVILSFEQGQVVIADASPLIGLTRVGGLMWLAQLFGKVYLTPTVLHEVLPGTNQRGEPEIQAALTAGWLKVWREPNSPLPFDVGDLDAGESESIALAFQLRPAHSLLLIDERAGRAAATKCDLPIIGTSSVTGAG